MHPLRCRGARGFEIQGRELHRSRRKDGVITKWSPFTQPVSLNRYLIYNMEKHEKRQQQVTHSYLDSPHAYHITVVASECLCESHPSMRLPVGLSWTWEVAFPHFPVQFCDAENARSNTSYVHVWMDGQRAQASDTNLTGVAGSSHTDRHPSLV